MKEISGGVCAPKGFLAGGVRCGIKESSKKKDLALIYSNNICTAAGVFTTNRVKAATVQVSKKNIAEGKIRAVIVNSGHANACTGKDGMDAALRMTKLVADSFEISQNEVAVASTGVIGFKFPIEVVEKGFDALKASLKDNEQGAADALEAIMTTDTRKKEIAVEITIDGKPVKIGAMGKGSGMMHPNMATMLVFITTDAAILPSALDKSLRKAVDQSFHRLTIDGDTSTNDTVLIMANGSAENKNITDGSGDHETFTSALTEVCVNLARKMARDGEGATKLVTTTVNGAVNEEKAVTLAKSVAGSSLVKAACFGADANWGRILCAMGYSGADFSPEKTDVSFSSRAGQVQVCENGESISFSEENAKKILSEEEIEIIINIKEGSAKASVWGCDLTYDYVKINGDYRS